MKGSRTILFNLVMAIAAMAGLKLAPDLVNAWLDVFVSIWAVGAMLLRQVTTTPVFQKQAAPAGTAHDIACAVAEALVQSAPPASSQSAPASSQSDGGSHA